MPMVGVSRASPESSLSVRSLLDISDPLAAWPTSCTTPLYVALDNEEGQDPCEIALDLLGACYENLKPSDPPPFSQLQNNICICNTVFYSLIFVCGLCSRTAFFEVLFSVYVQDFNCIDPGVQVYQHTIPSDVAIPDWAYLPLSYDQVDLPQARQVAGQSAIPSPTQPGPARTTSTASLKLTSVKTVAPERATSGFESTSVSAAGRSSLGGTPRLVTLGPPTWSPGLGGENGGPSHNGSLPPVTPRLPTNFPPALGGSGTSSPGGFAPFVTPDPLASSPPALGGGTAESSTTSDDPRAAASTRDWTGPIPRPAFIGVSAGLSVAAFVLILLAITLFRHGRRLAGCQVPMERTRPMGEMETRL